MLQVVAHHANNEGYRAGALDVMTITEVSEEFGVATDTVRQFLSRNPSVARKAGATWLILRSTARQIWGDE
jgi:predicted transcriptional regulator